MDQEKCACALQPVDQPIRAQRNDEEQQEAKVGRSCPSDLQRFVAAQCGSYSTALAEIKKGGKNSCWIWYVFPQFLDPGRSSANNTKFQIFDLSEGAAFLFHSVLGAHYREIGTAALAHLEKNASIISLFHGQVDAKKFYHSISTFALCSLCIPPANEEQKREWENFFERALPVVARCVMDFITIVEKDEREHIFTRPLMFCGTEQRRVKNRNKSRVVNCRERLQALESTNWFSQLSAFNRAEYLQLTLSLADPVMLEIWIKLVEAAK